MGLIACQGCIKTLSTYVDAVVILGCNILLRLFSQHHSVGSNDESEERIPQKGVSRVEILSHDSSEKTPKDATDAGAEPREGHKILRSVLWVLDLLDAHDSVSDHIDESL